MGSWKEHRVLRHRSNAHADDRHRACFFVAEPIRANPAADAGTSGAATGWHNELGVLTHGEHGRSPSRDLGGPTTVRAADSGAYVGCRLQRSSILRIVAGDVPYRRKGSRRQSRAARRRGLVVKRVASERLHGSNEQPQGQARQFLSTNRGAVTSRGLALRRPESQIARSSRPQWRARSRFPCRARRVPRASGT